MGLDRSGLERHWPLQEVSDTAGVSLMEACRAATNN